MERWEREKQSSMPEVSDALSVIFQSSSIFRPTSISYTLNWLNIINSQKLHKKKLQKTWYS